MPLYESNMGRLRTGTGASNDHKTTQVMVHRAGHPMTREPCHQQEASAMGVIVLHSATTSGLLVCKLSRTTTLQPATATVFVLLYSYLWRVAVDKASRRQADCGILLFSNHWSNDCQISFDNRRVRPWPDVPPSSQSRSCIQGQQTPSHR